MSRIQSSFASIRIPQFSPDKGAPMVANPFAPPSALYSKEQRQALTVDMGSGRGIAFDKVPTRRNKKREMKDMTAKGDTDV